MDIKIWVYIIIGGIYLISWIMKQFTPKPTESDVPDLPEPRRQPQGVGNAKPTSTKPKTLTFEELLREISESKTTKQPPKPVLKPAYVDYDDNIEPEEKSLEKIPTNYRKKDNIYDVYEEGKKQAFARPSLEETMKLQDTDTKYARFKIFEQEDERNYILEEYTRGLQDPEGFKKAFVMSEILKRKF